MKHVLFTLFDKAYSFFERCLIVLFYGKWRRSQTGWRGKYANEMYLNAQRVRSNLYMALYPFEKRTKEKLPEQIETTYSALKWKYMYRFFNTLTGVKVDDWYELNFFHVPFIRKWRYLTHDRMLFFCNFINDQVNGETEILNNKVRFADHWNTFFRRKYLLCGGSNECSEEYFTKLFSGAKIIIKPIDKYKGLGIRVFEKEQVDQAYEFASQSPKEVIVEEYIEQKGVLHELNPSSLNTVRITTIMNRNKEGARIPREIYSFLRVGKEGEVVDNCAAGGDFYYINNESGYLFSGWDRSGHQTADARPGIPWSSFQVPHWGEAKAFCREAHLHAPESLNIIGWDVCISGDDLFMIEGNACPETNVYIEGTRNPWRWAKRYMDGLERRKNRESKSSYQSRYHSEDGHAS